MDYIFADITITPYSEDAADLLAAYLGDIGFDSFENTDNGLKAYILKDSFDDEVIKATLAEMPSMDCEFSYTIHELEQRDWNEQWEQEHFDPVLEREYGIRLQPRMAFGSGSHDTTHQIVELLMGMDFTGQRVLDMGTGTGVLAIAMSKRNAEEVVAIDIDEFSVENAKDNIMMNCITNVEVLLGDASVIEGEFDTIVTNIHKNIIKADMHIYTSHLRDGGTMAISGFFDDDVDEMAECANAHGLTVVRSLSQNGWAVLVLAKH